ncbi:UNVERIFIED_CONTAM: hypothetical protein K2H54_004185 [Gekko kuhli]
MSADKEITIPVTIGETIPVSTGMTATLNEEGAGGTKQIPIPFGGVTAKEIQILCTVHPVSLLAWMREAADAESHLKTIRIDNAVTLGKGTPMTCKPKTPSRQKEGVWEQHMKQDLCLKCGEPGHFTAACPGQGTTKKGPEKICPDTPVQKTTGHPKTQCALQMSFLEEHLELSDNNEEEPAGKGQDLL